MDDQLAELAAHIRRTREEIQRTSEQMRRTGAHLDELLQLALSNERERQRLPDENKQGPL